jgi:hypothetical protein
VNNAVHAVNRVVCNDGLKWSATAECCVVSFECSDECIWSAVGVSVQQRFEVVSSSILHKMLRLSYLSVVLSAFGVIVVTSVFGHCVRE